MKPAALLWVCFFLLVSARGMASSPDYTLLSFPAAGVNAGMQVKSVTALRFQGVTRQQEDYSCGAAALSTLLTHHYGDRVTEKDILDSLMKGPGADRIRKQGLSMLDMKSFLESRGYSADGYRMAPETLLSKAGVPVIALINVEGYRHFVVIKGMRRDMLLVGDPARGLRRITVQEFNTLAGDALLLVRSHAAQGKRFFNVERDWHAVPDAPLGSDIVRPHRNGLPLDRPTASPF